MNETRTKTEICRDEIKALLRARNILLWVTSREELRAERAIIEAAGAVTYETRCWDCATGLSQSDGSPIDQDMRDPNAVLAKIRDDKTRCVYVLRDLHRWLDPVVLRMLRTLARLLQAAPPKEARTIIILSPSGEIPPDLSGQITAIDFPLPERRELGDILDSIIANLPEDVREKARPENGARDAAIDAAIGLCAEEASSCYAKSLVTSRTIDAQLVAGEKRRVITRERVLSWSDPDPRGLDAIGGLDELKRWLTQRRVALTRQARDYGLPAIKGILLVGVPGCGKSLTAKAVAAAWGVPLLRLDMGALRSKWVGESESNIRKALAVAETVAPCVLWLDEIEKAMSGATSGAADGGVSADALGSILSWMQERTTSVFVVATANNVEALPPELMRKGRFDELFFVDLPNGEEREAILDATLTQYKRDGTWIAAPAVAAACDGFSGAEIAALVPEAMFAAFADGQREITTEDLLTASLSCVPLSKSSGERITALRAWAKGRARNAIKQTTDTKESGRRLDL